MTKFFEIIGGNGEACFFCQDNFSTVIADIRGHRAFAIVLEFRLWLEEIRLAILQANERTEIRK